MTCSGVRQRPTVRDAQPGIIDAALHRSRPVAPVGTGLRSLPATTSVPTARSARASAERRSSPSGTAGDWEFGWTTCPLTTTVYWRGCGWTPWAAKHRWTSGCSGPAHRQRLHAATRLVGVCEPDDIIANRLDPWHGAGFHPYSFTHLDVLTAPPVDDDLAEDADRFLVAVTFRIGRLRIPVVAEFTSPEPRTIVVRIVDGDGTGSVVETHATPVDLGADRRPRTAVLEAVIAHSDRTGFVQARKAGAHPGVLADAALLPQLVPETSPRADPVSRHDEPAAAAAQRRNPVRCGPAFQPRAGQGLPQTHRRLLPRHSFTSLLADLATICANHVQPAHDMPAFTMITTRTPLQRWAVELLGVSRRHGLA